MLVATERLPLLDKDTCPKDSCKTLDEIERTIGKLPNVVKAMSNSPATLKSFWALLSLKDYTLSPRLREAIGIAVSQENGCGYCLTAHTAMGKAAGLSAEETEKVRCDNLSDPKDRAAIDLAREIVKTKGSVSDKSIDEARKAGLSDRELAEVLTVTVFTLYGNYFNRFAHTPIDFPQVSNMPAE
jgi:uncharacterized peroxidase-related enzyme